MAIVSGVKPHNGWVEIGGAGRFQVINGQVEYNAVGGTNNNMDVTLPLNAPGYLEAIAPLTGNMSVDITAIVLSQGGEQPLNNAPFKIKKITFQLTATKILIHAEDDFSQLNQMRLNDSNTNMKGNEIVDKWVSGTAGLPFVSDPSNVFAGRKIGQDHVKLTDNISIMTAGHKMAETDGMRFYMDQNGVVNYKKAGSGDTYSIYWRQPTPQNYMVSDALDIKVIHNLDASGTWEHTQKSYDPSRKKTETATHTIQGSGKTIQSYQDTPQRDEDQTFNDAMVAAERGASHEWECQTTIVGDPSVTVDMNLQLSGPTDPLSQTFPIDSIVHNFGINGYTTTINGKTKDKSRE
jgi:hypothetical protein